MAENDFIFQEINEELKNDQLFNFLKKYKKVIFVTAAAAVVGILAYSSWSSRKEKLMEEVTNTLLGELQSPSNDTVIIEELLNSAPSELKPVLTIIKSGRNLSGFKDMLKNADALLDLSNKHGVDIVWKDLAVIIYASYRLKPFGELVKLLEPLSLEGRPFRFSAMEFLAMNCENNGDHVKAREYLQKIADDKNAPKTLKKRAALLLSHIKGSLEK